MRNQRDLIVYLPPGYDHPPRRAFPILYLHDGQNLFDGATSFIPGMDWHVGHTADQLIHNGQVAPLIIVGIYNAGKQRLGEYTPTRVPRLGGGRANRYAKFLLEEVRPFLQERYSVSGSVENTGSAALPWAASFLFTWGSACPTFSARSPLSRPPCGGMSV